MGKQALFTATNADDNVAIGKEALKVSVQGFQVAIGSESLTANTTGINNIGMGYRSLYANTSGGQNVAVGAYALDANTTADNNTAFGYAALSENTTGTINTGIGRSALLSTTTGSANTAVGSQAIDAVTTGGENTAIGADAGGSCTTGDRNTFIGRDAGYNITTGSRNTYVGEIVAASSAAVSLEYVLGNGLTGKGTQTCFLGGNTGAFNEKNVTTFETTSDERIKKNIVDNNSGLDILNQIQVRNFEYRTEEEIVDFDNPKAAVVKKEGVQLGVIAQELEKVLPESVKTQSTGVKTVDSDSFTWYLINAVKELSTKVAALEAVH